MNTPDMHALADFVEKLPHLESADPNGHVFDMAIFLDVHANGTSRSGPECQTIGCIAGSYCILRSPSANGVPADDPRHAGRQLPPDQWLTPHDRGVSHWAARGLDLTAAEAEILFTPPADYLSVTYSEITPAQAAYAIRQAVAQHERHGTFDESIWDHLQPPA